MINLCLESTSLLEKVEGLFIISLVENVSNDLGDRKEEVVMTPFLEKRSPTMDVDKGTYELEDTPLLEKKSSTKDFDKGTDELEYTKKVVVTISRKCLDKF